MVTNINSYIVYIDICILWGLWDIPFSYIDIVSYVNTFLIVIAFDFLMQIVDKYKCRYSA